MSGNKVTVGTAGQEVDFYAYGYFFNLYARSNADPKRLSGICSHQMVHSYQFGHPVRARKVHFRHHHCAKRAHFTRLCQKRKLIGTALKNCVFDLCAHTGRDLVF